MKQFPPVPPIEDAPAELLDGGHLWIQEKIDGAHLRFRLRSTGEIEFGDRRRVFDSGDVPPPYRHATEYVRKRLDRGTLQDAVADVGSVVFFAEATHRHAIDYEWERMPSILGFDVWSGRDERFLPPDAVETIYRRLGLEPVNTFRKEVRANDFRPAEVTIPDSEWYDGPAAGIVVRNKTGLRAERSNSSIVTDDIEPASGSPAELAAEYVTDERLEEIHDRLERLDEPVSFERLYDALLETLVRAFHHRLFHPAADVDWEAFRSAAAERTQQYLSTR